MKQTKWLRIAMMALGLGALAPAVKGLAALQSRDAESAFANPLAISGEGTAAAWNVVEAKVSAMREAGYDRLASGHETIDGLDVTWDVRGEDPKKVTIRVQAGGASPDTFTTFVYRP